VQKLGDALENISIKLHLTAGQDDTLDVITMISHLIVVIVMFLCFFSLSSSMSANILEQAAEIGILRAMGL
jgi:ABC-type lipoprotein release transport system permease subunit